MKSQVKLKISNPKKPNKNISISSSDEMDTILHKNKNMVVDFSFEGSFISCKTTEFNNYLLNYIDFIERLRIILFEINKLSQRPIQKLINSGEFTHCHKIKNCAKAMKIISCICGKMKKDDNYFKQNFENEEIFQLGLQSEIRLFGKIEGNMFRVYFIDYYHDFDHDERRNKRKENNYTFCPINTELKNKF